MSRPRELIGLLVERLVNRGCSDKEIARLIKCSRNTVRAWRLSLGLSSAYDPSKARKVDQAKLRALLTAGMNNAQIARRLSVTPATIKGHRRRLGFPSHTAQTPTKDWGLKRGEWEEGRAQNSRITLSTGRQCGIFAREQVE